MAVVIILLILAALIYFKGVRDPKWLRDLYKNRTPEQKQVIRYFNASGIFRKKWSDAEYDEFVSKAIPNLKQRAIAKIGLDEDQLKEIDPVCMQGYSFKHAYQMPGKDGLWRSSAYQITWIFFSDTQVYLYQKDINFDDNQEKEHMEEYFFKDITNFATTSETIEVDVVDKKGNKHKETLNTNKFKLVVPGDSLFCAMTQDDATERAIQAMKSKLREKKQA